MKGCVVTEQNVYCVGTTRDEALHFTVNNICNSNLDLYFYNLVKCR